MRTLRLGIAFIILEIFRLQISRDFAVCSTRCIAYLLLRDHIRNSFCIANPPLRERITSSNCFLELRTFLFGIVFIILEILKMMNVQDFMMHPTFYIANPPLRDRITDSICIGEFY